MSASNDPDDLAKAVDAARRGWEAVVKSGGLVTVADIARRWGVEHETARGYTGHPKFPKPVARAGRSDLWLAAEADQWRATSRKRGRPPKQTTTG